jgi:aspartyl-tRNA(Asn)/glutamyl-tRNA(Gln) amidotransferase subunit B
MNNSKYQVVIGLEIHAELNTRTKMFCSCLNDPDEKTPNTNICPVCMAHPGTLPVINKEAVEKTIKANLALNCKISKKSKFDRKSYFYPDLPKGYQISQYDLPFGENGFLEIDGKKIRIERIHLEEDTGRLIHDDEKESSLVDFNRAGVPLMELVTKPDISSAEEARKFAEELKLIFKYLDVSLANMEKGQMRIEVNISLKKGDKMGTKVEIKNLNSFRSVVQGINYEIERQRDLLDRGGEVIQETRGWSQKEGKTVSQRIKEEAHDYRYFPEPDLPPVTVDQDYINKMISEIPELPQRKRKRLKEQYELADDDVETFVKNKKLGEYFEKVSSELANWVKAVDMKEKVEEEENRKLNILCANYIITDLLAILKENNVSLDDLLITPENFAEFITLRYKKKISSKTGKVILEEMFKTGGDPSQIIEEKDLTQIKDSDQIHQLAKEVIDENPDSVEDYRSGKENVIQFLIGQLMKKTKGKANPEIARKKLEELLK